MQEKSILRGDLALIKLGKYVILMENVTLRPSYKKGKGKITSIIYCKQRFYSSKHWKPRDGVSKYDY